MASMQEMVSLVRDGGRAGFVAAVGYPVLVRETHADSDEQPWTFKTQTLSLAGFERAAVEKAAGAGLPTELAGYEVFPVLKSTRNPWPTRISIGRARNNDIVLVDPSVSKLHAHFVRKDDGTMTLADVGSSNGTQVAGRAVAPGEVVQLGASITLVFGAVELRYYEPDAFYDFVSTVLAGTGG